MFTGLVEETGRVTAFEPASDAWRLVVAAGTVRGDAAVGDSIAVNGCCLTVSQLGDGCLGFDVLEETRRLTNFPALRTGALINLERSLAFGGKVGGHFVTGHIDTVGVIEVFEPRGKDHYLRIRFPEKFDRYVVHKGSIALDGISMTIAEVAPGSMAVWVIPHTRAVTDLAEKKPGDVVNLEFDLLGKYVEKLLSSRSS
jgi:riboflavin synthase